MNRKPTPEEFLKEKKDTMWMMARFPFPEDEDVFALNNFRVIPKVVVYKNEEHFNIINLREFGILDEVLKSKCLEIGCGAGKGLEQLYDHGTGTFCALEPEMEAFEFVTNKFKDKDILVINKTFEEAKFQPEIFDFIYSHHVIEHIRNPLLLIEKSKEWLKVGGKLMVSSPNADGFHPRVFGIDKWRNTFQTHVWLPGKNMLFKILERSGFKILKFITYGGFEAPRNIFGNIGNWLLKKFNMGDLISILAEKI